MSDIAIRIEDLGKQYRLGEFEPYRTLRESIQNACRSAWRSLRRGQQPGDSPASNGTDTIWALRDVSLEVPRGEVLGIIGRNGAGKSTLLKILSRITEPTTGQVEIRGRVASLLEVGTGFHPELTGRENVFVNGAILGMTRAEIKRKFDEIVDFSGVEKFIDTPVKRYSSGMQVRLAFAVAAHLEPEIMVVDEVLAVGDAEFQKKCVGKMSEVATGGRTVLFVSHNMAAIQALCDVCFLFDKGELCDQGPPTEVIEKYYFCRRAPSAESIHLISHPGRTRSSTPMMKKVRLLSDAGSTVHAVPIGSALTVEVQFDNTPRVLSPVLGVVIKTFLNVPVFGIDNRTVSGYQFGRVSAGEIRCHLDALPLMPGTYIIDLYFGDEHRSIDVVHDAISFDVTAADIFGTGKLPPTSCGPLCWPASWSLQSTSEARVLGE